LQNITFNLTDYVTRISKKKKKKKKEKKDPIHNDKNSYSLTD